MESGDEAREIRCYILKCSKKAERIFLIKDYGYWAYCATHVPQDTPSPHAIAMSPEEFYIYAAEKRLEK